MIVFIALILVAAVASTIIIKTAEELQQNAESTSDDTRKEISGKVNIIQIIVNGTGAGGVKNPVDHPHGGGEGKSAGGRHPVSRTGQSAKGLKTRDNKRTDKFIVRRRKKRG